MGPRCSASSPVWHSVWCWEHSAAAVLLGASQRLSLVDVPHLSVFRPRSEQFRWRWHGSEEEPPVEKWPAGQRSHTVSLSGVPVRQRRQICIWPTTVPQVSSHTPGVFSVREHELHCSAQTGFQELQPQRRVTTHQDDIWQCDSGNESPLSFYCTVLHQISVGAMTACDITTQDVGLSVNFADWLTGKSTCHFKTIFSIH